MENFQATGSFHWRTLAFKHHRQMTVSQRVPPSAVESRDHGLGHEADIGTPVAAPRTMTADQGEAVIQPVWPVLGAPTP